MTPEPLLRPVRPDSTAGAVDRDVAGAGRTGRWWLPLCALGLLCASDYKFRVRSPEATLAGGVDVFIVLEILVYAAVAAYLLATQPRLPVLRRTTPLMFCTGAYVAVLLVGAASSPYPALAGVRALETAVLLALVVRVHAVAERADLHRLAHGFLLLVAASVVVGVVHPMPAVSPQQVGRFSWLQVHPITAGVYLGLATVIGVVYLVTGSSGRPGPRWPRPCYIVLLAVVTAGLCATRTRSAVLGAVAGVVVLLALVVPPRHRSALLAGLGLAAATVYLAVGGAIATYFERGEDAAQLATFNSRTSLWSAAWRAVQHEPLFGYGLSASRGIFLDDTGLGGGHNALVNVAVDLGLVGLLLWLGVVVLLARSVLRAPAAPGGQRVDRALLLGVLAFLLVDGIFFEGVGATSNVAADWLFLAVGWAAVLVRRPVRQGSGRTGSVPTQRLST